MASIKKGLVLAMALLMFSVNIPVQAKASQTIEPIWLAEVRFQNQDRAEGRPMSDGVMAAHLRQLFRSHTSGAQESFAGIDAFRAMERSQFSRSLNRAARNAMNAGLQDSFFDYVGPGREFLRAVNNTTYTHFVRDGARYNGHLAIYADHNRMLIIFDQEEEFFVHLMLDELGHAYFGFTEGMAAFFAERGRGVEYAQHGPHIGDVIRAYYARGMDEHVGILSTGGSLAYYTNFERVLENVLDQQGRAHELWDAAMTSQEAKQDLWDSIPEMADIISFDDLQMVRGVGLIMGHGFRGNPEMQPLFEAAIGMSYEAFARQYSQDWRILTGKWHPEFEIRGGQSALEQYRAAALLRFQSRTQAVVNFGISNEISADGSEAEGIMQFYRMRFEGRAFNRALRR